MSLFASNFPLSATVVLRGGGLIHHLCSRARARARSSMGEYSSLPSSGDKQAAPAHTSPAGGSKHRDGKDHMLKIKGPGCGPLCGKWRCKSQGNPDPAAAPRRQGGGSEGPRLRSHPFSWCLPAINSPSVLHLTSSAPSTRPASFHFPD